MKKRKTFTKYHSDQDVNGPVTIQVKVQRQKEHRPMMADKALKILPAGSYVVETQRTRGGKDSRTGENTRPYRFGEFDIIAVSMHPSTNSWNSYRYAVATGCCRCRIIKSCCSSFSRCPLSLMRIGLMTF